MSLLNRMCCLTMLLGVALNCSAAIGQEAADTIDQEYSSLLETLIEHVGEGRIDDAATMIEEKSFRPIKQENREGLKRSLAALYGNAGKYDGCEIVAVKPISSRLHRAYALAYFEQRPIVFYFTMYQFDREWRINDVHWNDNVPKLVEATNSEP